MKHLRLFAILALLFPAAAGAQEGFNATTNPITSAVKGQMPRFDRNFAAGAQAMPIEKYNFQPTADVMKFGILVFHIAKTNYVMCSGITGIAVPESKFAETDAKDKLIVNLKNSFDFCRSGLANVDDSKLGEQVPIFRGRTVSRGAALLILSGEWNDHYSAMAIYLRLNGIEPPTVQEMRQMQQQMEQQQRQKQQPPM